MPRIRVRRCADFASFSCCVSPSHVRCRSFAMFSSSAPRPRRRQALDVRGSRCANNGSEGVKAASLAKANYSSFIDRGVKGSHVRRLRDLVSVARRAESAGAMELGNLTRLDLSRSIGLYALHLRCWLSVVDRSQILLVAYEGLKRDPYAAMRRAVSFIAGPEAVDEGSRFAKLETHARAQGTGGIQQANSKEAPYRLLGSLRGLATDPMVLRQTCAYAKRVAAAYAPHNRMLDALLKEGGGPPMEQWPFPTFEGTPAVLRGCPNTDDALKVKDRGRQPEPERRGRERRERERRGRDPNPNAKP